MLERKFVFIAPLFTALMAEVALQFAPTTCAAESFNSGNRLGGGGQDWSLRGETLPQMARITQIAGMTNRQLLWVRPATLERYLEETS